MRLRTWIVVNAVMNAQSENNYAPMGSRNMIGLCNYHMNSNLFVHVCASACAGCAVMDVFCVALRKSFFKLGIITTASMIRSWKMSP